MVIIFFAIQVSVRILDTEKYTEHRKGKPDLRNTKERSCFSTIHTNVNIIMIWIIYLFKKKIHGKETINKTLKNYTINILKRFQKTFIKKDVTLSVLDVWLLFINQLKITYIFIFIVYTYYRYNYYYCTYMST